MKTINLTGLDTSQVTNMARIFNNVGRTGILIQTRNSEISNNVNNVLDGLIPLGTPLLDANGGQFESQKNAKQYFTKVVYTPEEFEAMNKLAAFEQFKQENVPTNGSEKFSGWQLIKGDDSGVQNVYPDLYGVKYQAQWGTIEGAPVTVKYVDEGTGREIATSKEIKGEVGDSYDATTPEYKLDINGYVLDKSRLPINAKGTFTEEMQEIVYYYKTLNNKFPSENVDNVKPEEISSYGIAYMPKQFQIESTVLKDVGPQSIPVNRTDRFDVGVRDLRNTSNQWTLKAQLVWNKGKELSGSSIKTANATGTVMKNVNNGMAPFNPTQSWSQIMLHTMQYTIII
ncbi:MAG: MucBP domain-containing protein [Lactobacillus sp.]|nr:MucBP domain-containing protein [Lactobacillus sp.]